MVGAGAYGTKILLNAYESHREAKEQEERDNPKPKEEPKENSTSGRNLKRITADASINNV